MKYQDEKAIDSTPPSPGNYDALVLGNDGIYYSYGPRKLTFDFDAYPVPEELAEFWATYCWDNNYWDDGEGAWRWKGDYPTKEAARNAVIKL